MSQPEITRKVQDVLATQLGLNESDITPGKTWADLGADSIEEAFGFEIPDEEAERLKTVGELIEYFEDRCGVGS